MRDWVSAHVMSGQAEESCLDDRIRNSTALEGNIIGSDSEAMSDTSSKEGMQTKEKEEPSSEEGASSERVEKEENSKTEEDVNDLPKEDVEDDVNKPSTEEERSNESPVILTPTRRIRTDLL
jgi:hypothetical protein